MRDAFNDLKPEEQTVLEQVVRGGSNEREGHLLAALAVPIAEARERILEAAGGERREMVRRFLYTLKDIGLMTDKIISANAIETFVRDLGKSAPVALGLRPTLMGEMADPSRAPAWALARTGATAPAGGAPLPRPPSSSSSSSSSDESSRSKRRRLAADQDDDSSSSEDITGVCLLDVKPPRIHHL